jgi:hypothetical protein
MPKRDSASRLLRELVKQKKGFDERARLYASVPGLLGQVYREKEQIKLTYLNEPLQRALHANKALTLSRSDDALKKAFEVFGLDARDPYDWRTLLTYFAEAHFGAKQQGAPKKWTIEQICQFLSDFLRVADHYQTRSIKETCELMRSDKSLKGKYKSVPVETLRKQHQNALKGLKSFRAEHLKRRSRSLRNR